MGKHLLFEDALVIQLISIVIAASLNLYFKEKRSSSVKVSAP
jgi:hypothetical protein